MKENFILKWCFTYKTIAQLLHYWGKQFDIGFIYILLISSETYVAECFFNTLLYKIPV